MATVTLHVGAFKTGTSFVQTVLSNNKERLAADGVLWPGDHWSDQVRAVKGLMSSDTAKLQHWMKLVDEIDNWSGRSAIVSMETLSLVDAGMARKAIDSLSSHRVRVVLTARDIGRVFPAQWQESVQNKWTWSYVEYIDGVINGNRKFQRAHRHFWFKQDWPKLLRAWQDVVPVEDLVVVTVPPAGAPRGLLWERFCEACEIEPSRYDSSTRVNESLGAASAEVMRHVTIGLNEREQTGNTVRVIKKTLAKKILAARKSDEPSLVFPPAHQSWALNETKRMLEELLSIGPRVIGDLDELVPAFDPPTGPTTFDPSSLPTEQLMGAAAHGLVELCELLATEHAGRHGRRKRRGR